MLEVVKKAIAVGLLVVLSFAGFASGVKYGKQHAAQVLVYSTTAQKFVPLNPQTDVRLFTFGPLAGGGVPAVLYDKQTAKDDKGKTVNEILVLPLDIYEMMQQAQPDQPQQKGADQPGERLDHAQVLKASR